MAQEGASLVQSLMVRDSDGDVQCPRCRFRNASANDYCIDCGVSLVVKRELTPANNVELFTDSWLGSVHENTVRFYESLHLPSWDEMNNPDLKDCAVTMRHLVIDGSMESGKTAKVNTIIQHIIQKYGGKNVFVLKVQGEDFIQVLTSEWQHKPVAVICVEDATDKTFRRDEMARFWEIRHVMQEKTRRNRGLVVTIISTHSWFKIPDEFRTVQVSGILFSDIPTSPKGTFHRNIFNQFIPDATDRKRLLALQEQRLGDPKLRGFSYWLRYGQPTGFIYLPQVSGQQHKSRWHLPTINFSLPKKATSPSTKSEKKQSDQQGSYWPWVLLLAVATLIVIVNRLAHLFSY